MKSIATLLAETDFNDPADRLRLIERVGPDEYSRLLAEHRKASVVETVAGHDIRPVSSRFGELFMVGKTNCAFSTLKEARDYATANPFHFCSDNPKPE